MWKCRERAERPVDVPDTARVDGSYGGKWRGGLEHPAPNTTLPLEGVLFTYWSWNLKLMLKDVHARTHARRHTHIRMHTHSAPCVYPCWQVCGGVITQIRRQTSWPLLNVPLSRRKQTLLFLTPEREIEQDAVNDCTERSVILVHCSRLIQAFRFCGFCRFILYPSCTQSRNHSPGMCDQTFSSLC